MPISHVRCRKTLDLRGNPTSDSTGYPYCRITAYISFTDWTFSATVNFKHWESMPTEN